MADDRLVAELRQFILSFGEHDPECAGFDAMGPAAVDPKSCQCGFIPRMEQLLLEIADRL